MKSFKNIQKLSPSPLNTAFAAILLGFQLLMSTQTTWADAPYRAVSEDYAWLRRLTVKAFACTIQPVQIRSSAPAIFEPIQSICEETLEISENTAHFHIRGTLLSIVLEDSEGSDNHDLNDVYLNYGDREDQSVLIARNVLAYGDPILALLQVTGENPEKLRKIIAKTP